MPLPGCFMFLGRYRIAFSTLSVKVDRILVIAGPAFVIAGLFLANWLKRGELRPRAQ